MNRSPSLGSGSIHGHGRPLPNGRPMGVNKKRQFLNNLHHQQHMVLYGSNLAYQQQLLQKPQPKTVPQTESPSFPPRFLPQEEDEMYWSEYRVNYEKRLKLKME